LGGEGEGPASDEGVGRAYETGLALVARELEEELERIAERVRGTGSADESFVTIEGVLPALVQALRTAVDGVTALEPPARLREDHARLIDGLGEIIRLEEELLLRVEAGDPVGALARSGSIAVQQTALEGALSTEIREAAGTLLGLTGAFGFLPLAASDLAPSTAAGLTGVDGESYLAALDYPDAERRQTRDPLVVGDTVLITAQWSVPASISLRELLDFYDAGLRALGAEGESQRSESSQDGVVTVGGEHPFGSAIVMVGAGEDGSYLVSVTGSFPAQD